MNKLFYLFVILILINLSGCSPQYKIINDFIPPDHDQGLSCISKTCHVEAKQCNHNCSIKYENCLNKKEELADIEYTEQANQYQEAIIDYQAEQQEYNEQLDFYLLRKENISLKLEKAVSHCKKEHLKLSKCHQHTHLKRQLKDLSRPLPPEQPVKPNLHNITHEMQRSCSKNCQCDKSFQQCYIGCGGEIHSRKVCIANCD